MLSEAAFVSLCCVPILESHTTTHPAPLLRSCCILPSSCSPGGDVEKDITAARSEANTTLAPGEVGMLAPQGQVKLWTTGIPIRCPGGTWTEEEGAKTVDECGEWSCRAGSGCIARISSQCSRHTSGAAPSIVRAIQLGCCMADIVTLALDLCRSAPLLLAVARPGSYIAAGNETTPIMAVKCPTGTYKEVCPLH